MTTVKAKQQAKARLRQMFAESGFSVSEETAAKTSKFLETFDPSKLYPQNWWEQWLNGPLPRRSYINASLHALPNLTGTEFEGLYRKVMKESDVTFEELLLTVMSKGFSYSIPTVEAVADIGKFAGKDVITEYMAGSGYWAFLMRQWGVKILASDVGQKTYAFNREEPFVEMFPVDVLRMTERPTGALMMSWIPHMVDIVPVLKRMDKGQKFIYIGDPSCCSCDYTHNYFDSAFKKVYERQLFGAYGPSIMRFYVRARNK